MLNKIIFPTLFLFLTFSLYLSCANEVRPTGGPRDTIPPLLTKSVPSTKSTNFSGNTLILEFNEFIKTDKLNTQLLITPRLDSEYKVKQISKRIQIEFEDENPFAPNTTYTFNFQNAIKDLTEGNPWLNSKIVFSTGDFLDSLFIEGHVFELLTHKPLKNAVVSIYYTQDTLNPITGKPQYFTVTDDKGYFLLENLISNSYRIYSFNDKNNNLTLDASNESYGFLPDSINLFQSLSSIVLNHISLNINELRLVSARPFRYYFDLSFNKSLTDYDLVPISNDVIIISNLIDQQKKIRVYNTIPLLDSLHVSVISYDSLENTVYDSLYIKFAPSTLPSEKLTQTMFPANNKETSTDFSGSITFNKPIKSINYDSIYFAYDSATFDPLTPENISFNKQKDVLYINKKLNIHDSDKPSNYNFNAPTGSFMSIENDSSQRIQQNYKILNPINYGSIQGTIQTESQGFILQLLSTNFNVEMESKNLKKFNFRHVPPGNYYIRLLIDTNLNGHWDPGNILENRLPEPVVFYKNQQNELETISIKANWEITDINLSFPE
jgi:hypothetical protein